jgi:negative regulator of genetic competence, sporulation and motility
MKLTEEFKAQLVELGKEKKVFLEGNILKVIELEEGDPFKAYVDLAVESDKEIRKKRLEITKQVQAQNKDLERKRKELEEKAQLLEEKAAENDRLMEELKEAVQLAEDAKKVAENDLDLLQKRTQFELIGNIVKYALWVIVGCGIITTAMYVLAIFHGSKETTLVGNTWSNLFGILLTNSFSIIGTIMGVKYASDKTGT